MGTGKGAAMKKFTLYLLVLLMALSVAGPVAMAEEEGLGEAILMVRTPSQEEIQPLPDDVIKESEPFIPEGLDKAVVGKDDRTTITNTFSYPFSAISYLECEGKCGCEWTGSGFMIGKDVMLTAAHCLVCTDHGQPVKYLTAYFGYKSPKNYGLKYAEGTRFWVGTMFKKSDGSYGYDYQGMEWDYAYVKLKKNVGDTTGWFGFRTHEDKDFQKTPCCVTGYRHGVLKMDYGWTYPTDSEYLMHFTIDTQPCNSGCPVYDYDYYALGINVAEDYYGEYNVGRRITSRLYWDVHNDTD